MLRQFAESVLERLKALGAFATQWAVWAVIAFAALGLLLVALYAVDRDAFSKTSVRIRHALRAIAGWAALLLGVWLLGSLLLDLRDIHIDALATQGEATVVTSNDPDAPEILQFGPAAAYLQEKTYTRRLTLPPSFLERLGADGIGILAPYLQDPTAENVMELVDTFRRSGQDVVFTREVKKLEETPLSIKDADARVALDFLDEGTAQYRSTYNAHFESKYEFSNPLPEEVPVRFTFRLPDGSTRVKGFSLIVSGNRITEPDEHDNYVWEGKLAAGAGITAEVRYDVLGGGHWSYDVGSGRRRIEHFRLSLVADRAPRFSRTGIFPTRRSGNEMVWQLDDVITSQRIYVGFPHSASTEMLTQAWTLFPFALAAFVSLAVMWFLRRGATPNAFQLLFAATMMAVALGLTATLTGVLTITLSIVVVCALGALLSGLSAGRAWLAAIPAALVPLTALSPTFTGILLAALALLSIAAIMWVTAKKKPIPG